MSELKKIKQQKAFKVPENYFSVLEDKVMDRIEPKEEVQKINWLDRIVYQLQLRFSIPTAMVAGLALIIIYINLDQEKEKMVFSDAEIKNYLIEEYDDQVEEELFAMNFQEAEVNYEMSDEDIIEFLAEEEVDLEIIEEFLP